MSGQTDFEPQILAFACNYCAYAAADLAGSMRLSYPTNVKIIRLPCTGGGGLTQGHLSLPGR